MSTPVVLHRLGEGFFLSCFLRLWLSIHLSSPRTGDGLSVAAEPRPDRGDVILQCMCVQHVDNRHKISHVGAERIINELFCLFFFFGFPTHVKIGLGREKVWNWCCFLSDIVDFVRLILLFLSFEQYRKNVHSFFSIVARKAHRRVSLLTRPRFSFNAFTYGTADYLPHTCFACQN